ncbi:MAG: 3'(2'),5'-bisphosphate nucleotidase CysQ, partial [Alphaproteobacteria bacterium]
GGQHQWDNCAPVAVALAAGLHCSRIDGGPVVYNGPSTSIPDLLICRPEWSKVVLEAVSSS